LSLSSAWFAPLNRGSLNSAHIHGTDVPVEEPSTASNSEVVRFGVATLIHDVGLAAVSYRQARRMKSPDLIPTQI
jgi:hypothetical protein